MQNTLSELFRNIEAETGTHGLCTMTLEALKNTFEQHKIKNLNEFKRQLLLLFELVQLTKPRYAVLMDAFYKILDFSEKRGDASAEELIREIGHINASYELEKLQLVQQGKKIDFHNKNILLHDHSHSVHSILNALKQDGKEFNVIVAEQDIEKTEDNIKFLHDHSIPYQVIPAYMLSHIEEEIDIVFCGGVTFQENGNFVMDTGSKSIISHFRLEKKPVYLFISTSKLTLWPITKAHEVFRKPHRRKHHVLTEIEYERLKFSHDRVPLELIDHIVTEKGIHTPDEFRKMFNELFDKREEQRRKYLKK